MRAPTTFEKENEKPIIENLEDISLFYLKQNQTNIDLGRAYDPDGDNFTVTLDTLGNNFVRLVEHGDSIFSLQTLSDNVEPGIYNVTILVTTEDDSA